LTENIDGDPWPCDDCGMECDGWEAQACCTLCAWYAGTNDPEILGCADCTAREDI
jgi:hypothetical protein